MSTVGRKQKTRPQKYYFSPTLGISVLQDYNKSEEISEDAANYALYSHNLPNYYHLDTNIRHTMGSNSIKTAKRLNLKNKYNSTNDDNLSIDIEDEINTPEYLENNNNNTTTTNINGTKNDQVYYYEGYNDGRYDQMFEDEEFLKQKEYELQVKQNAKRKQKILFLQKQQQKLNEKKQFQQQQENRKNEVLLNYESPISDNEGYSSTSSSSASSISDYSKAKSSRSSKSKTRSIRSSKSKKNSHSNKTTSKQLKKAKKLRSKNRRRLRRKSMDPGSPKILINRDVNEIEQHTYVKPTKPKNDLLPLAIRLQQRQERENEIVASNSIREYVNYLIDTIINNDNFDEREAIRLNPKYHRKVKDLLNYDLTQKQYNVIKNYLLDSEKLNQKRSRSKSNTKKSSSRKSYYDSNYIPNNNENLSDVDLNFEINFDTHNKKTKSLTKPKIHKINDFDENIYEFNRFDYDEKKKNSKRKNKLSNKDYKYLKSNFNDRSTATTTTTGRAKSNKSDSKFWEALSSPVTSPAIKYNQQHITSEGTYNYYTPQAKIISKKKSAYYSPMKHANTDRSIFNQEFTDASQDLPVLSKTQNLKKPLLLSSLSTKTKGKEDNEFVDDEGFETMTEDEDVEQNEERKFNEQIKKTVSIEKNQNAIDTTNIPPTPSKDVSAITTKTEVITKPGITTVKKTKEITEDDGFETMTEDEEIEDDDKDVLDNNDKTSHGGKLKNLKKDLSKKNRSNHPLQGSYANKILPPKPTTNAEHELQTYYFAVNNNNEVPDDHVSQRGFVSASTSPVKFSSSRSKKFPKKSIQRQVREKEEYDDYVSEEDDDDEDLSSGLDDNESTSTEPTPSPEFDEVEQEVYDENELVDDDVDAESYVTSSSRYDKKRGKDKLSYTNEQDLVDINHEADINPVLADEQEILDEDNYERQASGRPQSNYEDANPISMTYDKLTTREHYNQGYSNPRKSSRSKHNRKSAVYRSATDYEQDEQPTVYTVDDTTYAKSLPSEDRDVKSKRLSTYSSKSTPTKKKTGRKYFMSLPTAYADLPDVREQQQQQAVSRNRSHSQGQYAVTPRRTGGRHNLQRNAGVSRPLSLDESYYNVEYVPMTGYQHSSFTHRKKYRNKHEGPLGTSLRTYANEDLWYPVNKETVLLRHGPNYKYQQQKSQAPAKQEYVSPKKTKPKRKPKAKQYEKVIAPEVDETEAYPEQNLIDASTLPDENLNDGDHFENFSNEYLPSTEVQGNEDYVEDSAVTMTLSNGFQVKVSNPNEKLVYRPQKPKQRKATGLNGHTKSKQLNEKIGKPRVLAEQLHRSASLKAYKKAAEYNDTSTMPMTIRDQPSRRHNLTQGIVSEDARTSSFAHPYHMPPRQHQAPEGLPSRNVTNDEEMYQKALQIAQKRFDVYKANEEDGLNFGTQPFEATSPRRSKSANVGANVGDLAEVSSFQHPHRAKHKGVRTSMRGQDDEDLYDYGHNEQLNTLRDGSYTPKRRKSWREILTGNNYPRNAYGSPNDGYYSDGYGYGYDAQAGPEDAYADQEYENEAGYQTQPESPAQKISDFFHPHRNKSKSESNHKRRKSWKSIFSRHEDSAEDAIEPTEEVPLKTPAIVKKTQAPTKTPKIAEAPRTSTDTGMVTSVGGDEGVMDTDLESGFDTAGEEGRHAIEPRKATSNFDDEAGFYDAVEDNSGNGSSRRRTGNRNISGESLVSNQYKSSNRIPPYEPTRNLGKNERTTPVARPTTTTTQDNTKPNLRNGSNRQASNKVQQDVNSVDESVSSQNNHFSFEDSEEPTHRLDEDSTFDTGLQGATPYGTEEPHQGKLRTLLVGDKKSESTTTYPSKGTTTGQGKNETLRRVPPKSLNELNTAINQYDSTVSQEPNVKNVVNDEITDDVTKPQQRKSGDYEEDTVAADKRTNEVTREGEEEGDTSRLSKFFTGYNILNRNRNSVVEPAVVIDESGSNNIKTATAVPISAVRGNTDGGNKGSNNKATLLRPDSSNIDNSKRVSQYSGDAVINQKNKNGVSGSTTDGRDGKAFTQFSGDEEEDDDELKTPKSPRRHPTNPFADPVSTQPIHGKQNQNRYDSTDSIEGNPRVGEDNTSTPYHDTREMEDEISDDDEEEIPITGTATTAKKPNTITGTGGILRGSNEKPIDTSGKKNIEINDVNKPKAIRSVADKRRSQMYDGKMPSKSIDTQRTAVDDYPDRGIITTNDRNREAVENEEEEKEVTETRKSGTWRNLFGRLSTDGGNNVGVGGTSTTTAGTNRQSFEENRKFVGGGLVNDDDDEDINTSKNDIGSKWRTFFTGYENPNQNVATTVNDTKL